MQTLKKAQDMVLDVGSDIVGGGLLAVAIQVFNSPNNIAPGGVNGIAILLNYLFGFPISIVSLLINVPLLLLAYLFLGRRFTVKTMRTVLISTAMLQLVENFLPAYEGEVILAALAGGVLSGIGLAVVFMRSSTTGGTDIVVRLIQRRKPDMAVGRLLLMVDALVLVAAALVYRNLESALFALVSIFTRTQIVDSILCGLDMGNVMMIVSQKPDEVADAINHRLRRGCTMLDGRGSYTKQECNVLMCVVRKSQYYELKKLVHEIDEESFIIAMEANEIIGRGFKSFSPGPSQ